MKSLMTTNIYEPEGVVLIAGTCLPHTQPGGFARIAEKADMVYGLCLEESHINMAITKISAMLSTGRVKKLIYATVDRSPHCTQLHFIDHEVRRTLPLTIETEHYVVADDRVYPIADAVIEQAKTLRTLAERMG